MLFQCDRYLKFGTRLFESVETGILSRSGGSLVAAAVALFLMSPGAADAKRSSHHAATSHQSSAHHSGARGGGHSTSRHSRAVTVTHVNRHGRHSIIATQKHVRNGRAVHVSNHIVHHAPVSYPEPHAEHVQNANSLAGVYRLYDRGVNERLLGQYEQATKTLREASNAYTSSQRGLTLEAMIEYELGQAAEANNSYSLAADAYARSLRIKPNLIEAWVRLTSMLMRAGQPQAALSRARDSVASNPNDPRTHQILALVLDGNGLNADAKIERESAERLLRSRASMNYSDVPTGQNLEPVHVEPEPDKPEPEKPDSGAHAGEGSSMASPSDAGSGNVDTSSETEARRARQEEQWRLYQQEHGQASVSGANETELRRARQEEQWRIYQQQHRPGAESSSLRATDRRPFQSAPGGEFYRARVEPANKPNSTSIPSRRDSSDFPRGAGENVKTYTPDAQQNAGKPAPVAPTAATTAAPSKGTAADTTTKNKPSTDSIDDEMP